MTDILLSIPILAGFFITLFTLPLWIRKARQIGLVWDDMNKLGKQKIAGSGGVVVLLGFIISVFIFVAYKIFYLNDTSYIIEIIALAAVIILIGGIGLIDDLFGWQHGGLSRRSRLIMVAIASIPLMAINAGKSEMALPFFGTINFGILYPLIIIPVGIVGATTTFNFLAGMNGLEAGQGIIILSALSIVAFLTGSSWLALIGLCMIVALIAFLFFNWFPAKVFPGDILTYSIGSLIAAMSILGNFEKIAVFFFIPYLVETILKLRGGLVKSSFGKPRKDNSLELLYDRVYGITHLSIWFMQKFGIKPTEKKVVMSIWVLQIIIILIGFIIFREGILI